MDVPSFADRISSAASAVATPPSAAPANSDPTPAAAAPSTPEPAAAPSEPVAPAAASSAATPSTPELTFEDDPAELSFEDTESAQQAAPAPAQPSGDDKAVADLNAVLEAGGLPKQIETAFMKTNRGRNLLSLYKSERVLKSAPVYDPATGANTGGLGYMPTPEQIKEYHQGHSDWQAVNHEFTSNPGSWATNWFGPDQQGQFREGADKVLANIPEVLDQTYNHAQQIGNEPLKQQAVQLYRTIFAPMLRSYLSGIEAKATTSGDPNEQKALRDAIAVIRWDMFGENAQAAAQPPAPGQDIWAERERELQEREQRLNAWQTKQLNDYQKQVENEVFATIDGNLDRDIEKALASVKVGMSERMFKAAKADFKKEIQQAVQKDHLGFRQFNFALSAARTARGADARAQAIRNYQQLSRVAIQGRYRQVLQELAHEAVRQNGAQHAAAAAAAAQTAPATSNGAASPQSVVPVGPKIERLPGESREAYYDRRVKTALGVPN